MSEVLYKHAYKKRGYFLAILVVIQNALLLKSVLLFPKSRIFLR